LNAPKSPNSLVTAVRQPDFGLPAFNALPKSEFATPAASTTSTAPITPATSPIPGQTSLEKYWGQPVWKGGMPLDQFVQLTGAAAHAFAPEEPSGILGKSLSDIAGGAYKERMRREYEGPNELLKRTAADSSTSVCKT